MQETLFAVRLPSGEMVLVSPLDTLPRAPRGDSRCGIYPVRSDGRKTAPVAYLVSKGKKISQWDLPSGTSYAKLREKAARARAPRLRGQTGGGIEKLTEIQERVLAPAMAGRDVLAKSKTGSGKTLAFLLPCVERMAASPGPGGLLVLTPTRELALQIAEAAVELCRPHDFRVMTVIGGESSKPSADVEGLERAPHVIVATPGRLKGLLTDGKTRDRTIRAIAPTRFFVLDEADRMVDPSFLPVVKTIRASMTGQVQTLLFSATMPPELSDLVEKKGLLRSGFETVDVVGTQDTAAVPSTITQSVAIVPVERQLDHLSQFVAAAVASAAQRPQTGGSGMSMLSEKTRQALRTWQDNGPKPAPGAFKVIVFLGAQLMVDFVSEAVKRRVPQAKVYALHGGMSQKERSRAYDGFRAGTDDFLFTTDASARGVDFPGVTHVVQLLYTTVDEYRQRLGRTGRAGRPGTGILYLDPVEEGVVGRNPAIPAEAVVRPQVAPAPALEMDARMAKLGDKAFRAWLGGLKSRWKSNKLDKEGVVDMALRMGRALGAKTDEARVRSKI